MTSKVSSRAFPAVSLLETGSFITTTKVFMRGEFHVSTARLCSLLSVRLVVVSISSQEVIRVKHFLFWLVVGIIVAGIVLKVKGIF